METVLVTGGTGVVGAALCSALLTKGYKVVVLTRGRQKEVENRHIAFIKWDPDRNMIDEETVRDADHIIHLAGAGIAEKRWTAKRKREILESRTQSASLLINTLKKAPNKVKTVISASAIGWYGPDTTNSSTHGFNETLECYPDFIGKTCGKWEQSIYPAKELGKRVVIMRTGIVLSKQDGAIKEFLKTIRYGIAAIIGNGKQIISWIHIDDLVNLYIDAIENKNMQGIYNAVSDEPVSNKKLVTQLAKSRTSFYIPLHIPAFFMKWMFGELSSELLKSCTVNNHKLRNTGFTFWYPRLDDAIAFLNQKP
jgi:uncharacterized protein (TIGR01777 family)